MVFEINEWAAVGIAICVTVFLVIRELARFVKHVDSTRE